MDINRFKRAKETSDPNHEKAWLEWLSDDPAVTAPTPPQPPTSRPEPRYSRGQVVNSYTPRYQSSPTVQAAPLPAPPAAAPIEIVPIVPATDVTININLPKVPVANLKRKLKTLKPPSALPYKRFAIGLVSLSAVGALAFIGQGHFLKPSAEQAASQKRVATKATAGSAVARSNPTFAPVVPKTRQDLAKPNGKTAVYDGARDTYSYMDTLQGTQLTVSQQPIPAKFSSAEEAVTKIAQQIGAKETIVTTSGTAYLATDDKSNSQTLVLSVKNVLIFIQSPFKHGVDNWRFYIQSLQ